MKDSLTKAGYNLEEVYFYQQNQKLIEKLKQENIESEKKNSNPRSHLRLVVDNVNPGKVGSQNQPQMQNNSKSNKKKAA